MESISVTENGQARQDALRLYKEAFPPEEQMPFDSLVAVAREGEAEFSAYYDDGAFCALTYVVIDESLVYLLYLAVSAEMQSKGYGSMLLDALKAQHPDKVIVLDIETLSSEDAPNMEQRLRRAAFYERNGFCDTGIRSREDDQVYDVLAFGGMPAPGQYAKIHDRAIGNHWDCVQDASASVPVAPASMSDSAMSDTASSDPTSSAF